MAKNFIQDGEVIDYVAGADITSGSGVVINATTDLFGVAVTDIANGASGPVAIEGVFELTALSTDVAAIGAKLYWDDTNKRLTVTSTANTLAGFAVKAKANGETVARVKLNTALV